MGDTKQVPTALLALEGAIASSGAVIVSNPFEVMKTRLQLQGEMQRRGDYTKQYKGMLRGMVAIARAEGLLALQKGFVGAIGHQVSQNGVRLGLYPSIKSAMEKQVGLQPGLMCNVAAGAVSGTCGAIACNPFYLVKTRLQAQNSAQGPAVGYQHHYTGVWDGIRSILKAEGVRGLYQGLTINCLRTTVGSAAQLASYDGAKARVSQQTGWSDADWRVHFAAGAVAAFCITVFMNPFDVVLTRSFNNSGDKKMSASIPVTMYRLARVEGVEGFYKGAFALWARTTPHSIVTFVLLEQIRCVRNSYLYTG